MITRIGLAALSGALLFGAACAQTESQTQPQMQLQAPPQTEPPAEPETQSQPPAHAAPSFDCSRAATVVEKEICAVAEFADLDSRIATLFAKALTIVSARDAEALRGDQRVWLKERDDCGNRIHGNPPIYADVYACLRDELNRREAFLRVVVASRQFTKP
jgi:uncharacterized protein YecT (DUF1311 family)